MMMTKVNLFEKHFIKKIDLFGSAETIASDLKDFLATKKGLNKSFTLLISQHKNTGIDIDELGLIYDEIQYAMNNKADIEMKVSFMNDFDSTLEYKICLEYSMKMRNSVKKIAVKKIDLN